MQFSYDRVKQAPFKISKQVEFSRHLSLRDFDLGERVRFTEYELYAVC